jgi:hypothetical protein
VSSCCAENEEPRANRPWSWKMAFCAFDSPVKTRMGHKAGEWTPDKQKHLDNLVQYAHQRGFWIRFFTLDGVSRADESCRGLFHLYNFGSRGAAANNAGKRRPAPALERTIDKKSCI